MNAPRKIAFFGSSLVSAYWNGAATYYRGILRNLHERGHKITFFEPDAFERQQHRDLADPAYARVVVYPATEAGVLRSLEAARDSDVIVKASGVGVYDELLEELVLQYKRPNAICIFWDVDAPATLERVQDNLLDPFRLRIPGYDLILTYGGGENVIEAYRALGAADCVPIYNALDPATHFPVPPDMSFAADLAFLGNRMPDREARVEEFFFTVARKLRYRRFLLGGSGWETKKISKNVRYAGHVYTADHNAFNSSPLAVLNINRDSMARFGFSPPTRIFEAAGAGAAIITDAWPGVEMFLEPGKEILIANNGLETAEHLQSLTPLAAVRIGEAALKRVHAEHTYAHRAVQVENVLRGRLDVHSGSMSAAAVSSTIAAKEPHAAALKIVILGLTITSSWGNGHATTYRSLIRALHSRGHDILFVERDVSWYARNRDLAAPAYCRVLLYNNLQELKERAALEISNADVVILGSYVPEGISVGDWLLEFPRPIKAFYDIDTPVTVSRLGRNNCEYLTLAQLEKYDLYLTFTGGPMLEHLKNCGARNVQPLYCSVDPDEYFPESIEARWDLGYMGTYSLDRQPKVEELLLEPARRCPDLRWVVAGPQYPDTIVWPDNTERIRHVPPSHHRHFYNSLRFTLNTTRADMVRAGYSPSVRLFEAAACGTPIISDDWEGLDQFFKRGSEILVARSADEVISFVRETPEKERLALSNRARQTCMAKHTAGQRAKELEQYVGTITHEHEPTKNQKASTRRSNNSAAD